MGPWQGLLRRSGQVAEPFPRDYRFQGPPSRNSSSLSTGKGFQAPRTPHREEGSSAGSETMFPSKCGCLPSSPDNGQREYASRRQGRWHRFSGLGEYSTWPYSTTCRTYLLVFRIPGWKAREEEPWSRNQHLPQIPRSFQALPGRSSKPPSVHGKSPASG